MTWFSFTKNSSTTNPTRTKVKSEKRRMQTKLKKIFDSVLGNNRTSYWQGTLFIIMMSDDNMKQHMEIINVIWEDNYCAMNLME